MVGRKQIHELLKQLGEDDDLRARMESNPVETLAEFGFKIDPAIAPFRVALPSKEHIRDNTELLAKQIEATSGWVIFAR